MGEYFTQEQHAELKRIFDVFDENKNGKIDAKEMGKLIRSLGQSPTDAEVLQMVAEADTDKSGFIEFGEFVQLMAKYAKNPESDEHLLKEAFRVFDKDGNGYVDALELKEALTKMGEPLTEVQVQQLIKQADRNGDGRIQYEEFVKWLSNN